MPDRQRLIDTLIDLIRIDSPSGEEDAIDREVSARLSSLGLTVEHDSYNNIVARLEGVGEPLLLSAHLDTVEPGRGIKPQLDGDTLRSDGTTILGGDCKAGVAIVLEALACVAESNGPHRAVEVAFSRHEEGGLVGVHHMDFSLLNAKTGIVGGEVDLRYYETWRLTNFIPNPDVHRIAEAIRERVREAREVLEVRVVGEVAANPRQDGE